MECPNPNRAVFEAAIAYLGFHGVPERQARSLVGKWRKKLGDPEIFGLLCDAYNAGVSDPVAWISKATANKSSDNSYPSEDVAWRVKLGWWGKTRFWRENFDGPPPGQPGCRVPRHLLDERGATE